MPLDTTPSHLACQLPADAYYQLVHTLRLTLPPPLTDSPEDLVRRDHAAIAGVAGLCPANAAEARLAAQFVAASEQWNDCLRLAQLPESTPEWAAKCRAQALSMMRQANSALRLLLSMQAARRKIEADNVGCDRAAWTEHCAIGFMAEALGHRPHPECEGEGTTFPLPPGEAQGEAQAAIPEPAAPRPAPAPCPDTGSKPEPKPAAAAEAEPDPACPGPRSGVADAEQYAAIYPERAAVIRRLGRLPDDVSFGPPDDDLVEALITARTPALAALDREFADPGERPGCPVPSPIRSPRHEARAA